MTQLDVKFVSKYETNWNPHLVFKPYKVRAILKTHNDVITAISERYQLQRRLKRELGEEGDTWTLQENPLTRDEELYMMDTNKILMWKLQDAERFVAMFDRIEQHTDEPDKLVVQPMNFDFDL
jgi:hypothetical protein